MDRKEQAIKGLKKIRAGIHELLKVFHRNVSREKLPCSCGFDRRILWKSADGYCFQCTICGKTSPSGKTEIEAIRNWNRMVRRERNDQVGAGN